MVVYRNIIKRSRALAYSISLVCASHAYSISLPEEGFDVSINSYGDDDTSLTGPLILARKSLSEERTSVKFRAQQISVSDDSTYLIPNAPSYSESHSLFSAGVDYLYFDSVLSFSSGYSSLETTGKADINIDITQELNNGTSALFMGYSHDWLDDSDIDFHQKIQQFRLGNKLSISPSWAMHTSLGWALNDGDLENVLIQRRFQGSSFVGNLDLPGSRAEQSINISSINAKRTGSLKTHYKYSRSNWGQTGHAIQLSFNKIHSAKLSTNYHTRYFTQSESKYYVDSLATPDAGEIIFQSTDKMQAAIKTKEFGVSGKWRFKQAKQKKIHDLKLSFGYSFIRTDYKTFDPVASTGNLIHMNLSGLY